MELLHGVCLGPVYVVGEVGFGEPVGVVLVGWLDEALDLG